ncbi:hypothetical protein GCM10010994_58810 [Chelatococcus reniformis]|uniref:Uncharacterized protein n=1 Tax=Chelatococcus reniformis TaxID=1494448 RepID=A0A916UZL7_9HYPH|nr:hypothetical protein GCM10010994_58810 [Chelatococcus reniformis]
MADGWSLTIRERFSAEVWYVRMRNAVDAEKALRGLLNLDHGARVDVRRQVPQGILEAKGVSEGAMSKIACREPSPARETDGPPPQRGSRGLEGLGLG